VITARSFLILALSVFSAFFWNTLCFAQKAQARVVTIDRVELKNPEHHWLVIAEPDHAVDLSNQELGFSFFNKGKVPPGSYINFRVLFSETTLEDGEKGNFKTNPVSRMELTAAGDLSDPLTVKEGSFIGVWFKLNSRDWPSKEVTEMTLTIDEAAHVYHSEGIKIVEKRA
jgi:hypothetical protein